MRWKLFVFLLVGFCGSCARDPGAFRSRVLSDVISLRVSLPDTYRHSQDYAYPLLIVLDGSTQFQHLSASQQFLSTFAIVPEMIVVGVGVNDRAKYFSPASRTSGKETDSHSGQAETYRRFLEVELFSYLKEHYRTAPYRVIFGHSLSGLFSSITALTPSTKFNAAISVSPSLWWDDFQVVDQMYTQQVQGSAWRDRSPFRWFVSMATEPDKMAEGFERLVNRLKNQPPEHFAWFTKTYAAETHDSTPLTGGIDGLKSLFHDWNAVPEISIMPLTALKEFYRKRTAAYGYHFPLGVHQYNVYGLKAVYEGERAWGIEILEEGVERFPTSDYLWDSLATAYALDDQPDAARVASDKAVELARSNDSLFLQEILAQSRQLKAADSSSR